MLRHHNPVAAMAAGVALAMATSTSAFALSTTGTDNAASLATAFADGVSVQVTGTPILVSDHFYDSFNDVLVSASAGTFSGGLGAVKLDSGVVLSTGNVGQIPDGNKDGAPFNDLSNLTGTAGFPLDLTDVKAVLDAGFPTQDWEDLFEGTVLEFDFFAPLGGLLVFEYTVATDEYPEWLEGGRAANDIFAAFLNGVNMAILPGPTPVTIRTLTFEASKDTNGDDTMELDGVTTVVLQAQIAIAARIDGVDTPHRFKLAMVDAFPGGLLEGDGIIDTAVFLKANSLRVVPSVPDGGSSLGLLVIALAGLGTSAARRRLG